MDEKVLGGPHLSITELSPLDAEILSGLRQKIDNIDSKKAGLEAEKFASKKDGRVAMIALEGSKPVGYLELKKTESLPPQIQTTGDLNDFAHLSRVGVLREARRKGIGTKLVKTAENWARGKDKKGLWLEHRKDNEPARNLYERAGYAHVGEFTDEKGNNRIVVIKEL